MCRSFLLRRRKSKPWQLNPTLWLLIASLLFHWLQTRDFENDFESWFGVKLCFAPACLELWSVAFEAWLLASLILVRNVVGELQPKRTLAASRGFLAAARLSCNEWMNEVVTACRIAHYSWLELVEWHSARPCLNCIARHAICLHCISLLFWLAIQ